jgi:hypothetical protein
VPKSPPAPAISASRYPASSLPRIPLVPDDVLKRNNVFCTFDTRVRRAARLLQCLWLKDHNIPTDTTVRQEGETTTVIGFASNLHPDAANAGKNFLTPAIHHLVLRELLLREEGAAIDEERLFANALSSMPLTFNLFGPLSVTPSDLIQRLSILVPVPPRLPKRSGAKSSNSGPLFLDAANFRKPSSFNPE